ncbi:acyltransferase [Aulographum hederae CBS 113979]|uniref:Acyltransferase n=1 Tax=Aulographum hederae CBS 113979 TaxID=1176131 RepID=A0A6G1GW86_9PEZI|nr:acyltransferase [Aulographum hederae CBS 113979]
MTSKAPPPSGGTSPRPSSPPTAPDLSILGDKVALHPAGYTEDPPLPNSAGGATMRERNVIESMARFRSSPFDFLREISLHVSGTGWRSYERIVGQPIFYAGFSERMKDMVLRSTMLRAKVSELAEKRVVVEEEMGLLGYQNGTGAGASSTTANITGKRRASDGVIKEEGNRDKRQKRKREIEASLMEVAGQWTDDMICKMESKRFIRGAYYIATALLTRAYHQGIHVNTEEILRLKTIAEQAEKKKQSIIFLPCHRSHVDYVSLQLICYRLGLALPVVVAGDNLNFPVVGPFLQHAGAMWIRRSFGDDQLYTTLVQAYIDTLLQNGYNFECFVEGGRSRTGKLLSPKFGILNFLLDSLLSGRVEDAIICPVSTQYDKVIEVDSYVSELLGQPKPKENLMDFLSASSILNLKLGRVDVRFHEPWSLRGFIDENMVKMPMQMGNSEEEQKKETRIRLLRTLGYRVLKEINDVSVVMPTALIGTVLLTLRGRGVGKTELIRRVEWLSERVKARGGRVAHFSEFQTATVVERGLEVLGPNLVGTVEGLPEETFYAVDRFKLSFYRNMTIHLFVLQSIVSAAMYMKVKQGGGPEQQRISFHDLREQVYFLSQLFRGEFIFPTEGLDVNLYRTLVGLESDRVIDIARHPENPDQMETISLSAAELESGRENFDFYCFLIWPFIEASWLGAISLIMLAPPAGIPAGKENVVWLENSKVQDRAQLLGKTLYHQGDLSYFEAVNKETLKNAYQRFVEEGILLSSRAALPNGKTVQTIRLSPEWCPQRGVDGVLKPEGKLWAFAELISLSRREGKNRRDGGTVRRRVLGLVETVAEGLWGIGGARVEDGKSVVVGGGVKDGEESASEGAAKRTRRRQIQTRASL